MAAEHYLDPLRALRDSNTERRTQLERLEGLFEDALGVVQDLGAINMRMEGINRSDLVMTERVNIPLPEGPNNLGGLNNFTPKFDSFGMSVLEPVLMYRNHSEVQLVGFRPYTNEERAWMKLLAGSGEYENYMKTVATHGIDRAFAADQITQTHISKKSFARLWLGLPEISEVLLDHCLERRRQSRFNISERPVNEEHFAAYVLMVNLVDVDDAYVKQDNGTYDLGILTR